MTPLEIKLYAHFGVDYIVWKTILIWKRKFKHNFHYYKDLSCRCSNSIESTIHFFLHYTRETLLRKTCSIDPNILAQKETSVIKTFLFRKSDLKTHLLKKSVSYYKQSVLVALFFQVDLSQSIALQLLLSVSSLFLLNPLLLIWFWW